MKTVRIIVSFIAFVLFMFASVDAFAEDWYECRVTFTAKASPTDKISRFEKWLPAKKAGSLGQAHVNARAAFAPGSHYQGMTVERVVGDPFCLKVEPPVNNATATRIHACRLSMKYKVFRKVGSDEGRWIFETKAFVGNPESHRVGTGADVGSAKTDAFSRWQSKIKNEWNSSPALKGEAVYTMVQFYDLVGSCWTIGSAQPSPPIDWPSSLSWTISVPAFP